MLKKIREYYEDPRIKGIDYDTDDVINIHRTILLEKKAMNNVFRYFYKRCFYLDNKYFSGKGTRIEIGGGVSFFNKIYPEVVITDIKKSDQLDQVLDAQQMNLDNETVRAIYGINCFHHFPEPKKFFYELERVLINGGGCILIDPYYGFLSRRMYPNLSNIESFDMTQEDWENSESGVMNGANQAKSYIVFKRDKKRFHEQFPNLEIVYQKPLNNYLEYLLSGGLNFKQLCPEFLFPVVRLIEFILSPISSLFALHHIIVIRKK